MRAAGQRADAPLASDVQSCAVQFEASDGYRLAGTLYCLERRASVSRAVVFNTGCGTRAFHYRHFGRYLASIGVPTLIYDYRGIGDSRPSRLRGFGAGFEEWGQIDCPAAIDFMRTRYPSAILVGVSHSIGCLVALASRHALHFELHVMICPHTGYFSDYAMPWRLLIEPFYRFVMPATAIVSGYFPASRFGVGDDLPKRVALQWASRTRPEVSDSIRHWDSERLLEMLACIKQAAAPTLTISSTDDALASEDGVRRFLFAAAGLSPIRRQIDPREFDVPGIGHWGFFRRRYSVLLWPIVGRFIVPPCARNRTSESAAAAPEDS